MKARYCDTPLEKLVPCDVGWGCYPPNEEGYSDCHQDPMEKNCRNIIKTDKLYCPYCKGKLEMAKEKALNENKIKDRTR